MSVMLGRVAKALQERALKHMIGNFNEADALDLASAAIEAMREPTERMLEVGDHGTSRSGWGYMIDEALK